MTKLSPQHIDLILNAEGKALATTGSYGLNVVPVSTIRVMDGNIWLMNYFFKKTLANIHQEPRASLVCWRGLDGVQIKGSTTYVEDGEWYADAHQWVKEHVPNRTLKGLLILKPEEIYSVAPTSA